MWLFLKRIGEAIIHRVQGSQFLDLPSWGNPEKIMKGLRVSCIGLRIILENTVLAALSIVPQAHKNDMCTGIREFPDAISIF